MITASKMIACGVGATQAHMFVEPLGAACERFEIDTAARAAAFLAQCMVESYCFVHLEERLYYTSPEDLYFAIPWGFRSTADASDYLRSPAKLAGRIHAGLNGNGDEASGDGYTYRRRGLLPIAGRERYADAAIGLGRSYLESPHLVGLPVDACLTAAWTWHNLKLNVLADRGAFDEISHAVNPRSRATASLRRRYRQLVQEALS